MRVVILTEPGLKVEGELEHDDYVKLAGSFGGFSNFLRLRDVTCERGGREGQYKEINISRAHIVSWRDADPSGQEQLKPEPEATA